jgi:hypothetical protein
MNYVKGECFFTNLVDYSKYEWPIWFCKVPEIGDIELNK